jgi:hypothetical protein
MTSGSWYGAPKHLLARLRVAEGFAACSESANAGALYQLAPQGPLDAGNPPPDIPSAGGLFH